MCGEKTWSDVKYGIWYIIEIWANQCRYKIILVDTVTFSSNSELQWEPMPNHGHSIVTWERAHPSTRHISDN